MTHFANWHTARSRALGSLYHSIDDFLPYGEGKTGITLRTSAIAGLAISIGSAMYFFAQPSKPSEAALLANSAAFASREELCVPFANPKTMAGFELKCSPVFDKHRKPNGKLIVDRLMTPEEKAADMAFQQSLMKASMPYFPIQTPNTNPNSVQFGVDEGIHVGAPDEIAPVWDQYAGVGAGSTLPERAPDELRTIRYEQVQIDAARKLQPRRTASTNKKNDTPTWKRCKARSYWSVKHNECRRKRG